MPLINYEVTAAPNFQASYTFTMVVAVDLPENADAMTCRNLAEVALRKEAKARKIPIECVDLDRATAVGLHNTRANWEAVFGPTDPKCHFIDDLRDEATGLPQKPAGGFWSWFEGRIFDRGQT